jgi:protein TonB
MLAYAANRPDPAGRRSSPNVMLFIVAAHVAAIAALMSVKMEAERRANVPTTVYNVPVYPPPPPPQDPIKQKHQTPPPPQNEWVTHVPPRVPQTEVPDPPFDTGGSTGPDLGPVAGTGTDPVPVPVPTPKALPVSRGPELLTPASQLRPPYPESKLINEEEATLHLRLTIGADGRVIAVEPIGHVDAVFLDAARRYLIAHWRYSPATIDGRAIASTNEITLSFKLDS